MRLQDAASICHPGPQDRTLDLADELIGQARITEAREIEQAAVPFAYREASKALQTIAINLHAYSRGMVSKQVVPSYLDEAQDAINAMRAAL